MGGTQGHMVDLSSQLMQMPEELIEAQGGEATGRGDRGEFDFSHLMGSEACDLFLDPGQGIVTKKGVGTGAVVLPSPSLSEGRLLSASKRAIRRITPTLVNLPLVRLS
jgi:hypothetical protein